MRTSENKANQDKEIRCHGLCSVEFCVCVCVRACTHTHILLFIGQKVMSGISSTASLPIFGEKVSQCSCFGCLLCINSVCIKDRIVNYWLYLLLTVYFVVLLLFFVCIFVCIGVCELMLMLCVNAHREVRQQFHGGSSLLTLLWFQGSNSDH